MYTLVQHTGYTVNGKPEFRRGVELRQVHGRAGIAKVRKAGGLLLATYGEARTRERKENYPDGYFELAPKAPGKFRGELSGEPLYVPVEGTSA